MKILKNPEMRRSFVICAAIIAAVSAGGYFVSPYCAVFAFFAGAAVMTENLIFAGRRYGEIRLLTEILDSILHGGEPLGLEDSEEGDLAALKSEIYKITLSLRERTHDLESEKVHLNDSIADISHQLRTPLTTINLIMNFLKKKELSEFERIKYLHEIDQQLMRIEWLISSLLKISKIDSGTAEFRKETVAVSDLIAAAAEPLLVPMEIKGQTFRSAAGGDEKFTGDPQWTTEALGNIIKNCMEHTPEGGTVEVGVAENNLYTEITVTDTGSGILQEDLPHLFERFYKGQNSSNNSVGIGLALTKMIIKQQNGSIKVENRRDAKGSKFTIRFFKKLI